MTYYFDIDACFDKDKLEKIFSLWKELIDIIISIDMIASEIANLF